MEDEPQMVQQPAHDSAAQDAAAAQSTEQASAAQPPAAPAIEPKEKAVVGEHAGNADADADAGKETDEEDAAKQQ